MKNLKKILTSCIIILSLSFYSAHAESSGRGPLKVSNRFPTHLMFLTPVPQAPPDIKKGGFSFDFSADYSSIFVNDESGSWRSVMDMEMTVLDFALSCGLTDRLSLSARLPLVSMNGGFLDHFLSDYHDALGLPNYNREVRPDNEFSYFVQKDGKNWFKAEDGGLHLADSSLKLSYLFFEQNNGSHQARAALSYALKMPLGDEESGFGSGGWDHGVYIDYQLDAKKFTLHLGAGYALLSDPDTLGAEIEADNILSGFLGGAYKINEKWSALAQLNYYSSPLDEKTGIRQLDDDALEFAFGLAYQLSPEVSMELAFSEDFTRAAPDFTVHFGLSYGFGS